jgi:hypothetical protein
MPVRKTRRKDNPQQGFVELLVNVFRRVGEEY